MNQDEVTSAADALAIINNLTMYSSRQLSWDDPTVFKVDVNNDGDVTALDALIVINSLSVLSEPSGEWLALSPLTLEKWRMGNTSISPADLVVDTSEGWFREVSLLESADFALHRESAAVEIADNDFAGVYAGLITLDEKRNDEITHGLGTCSAHIESKNITTFTKKLFPNSRIQA